MVTIGTSAIFNSSGTIAFNSNFNDFGAGFHNPGDPFSRGGVTYTSLNNLTVGSGTGYSIGDAQTVITNNFWTPITGTIATGPQYTLFGFDLAVTSGLVSVTVTTNSASYVYAGQTVANGNPNFTFEGFQATGGEYFTGFRVDSAGSGFLPGMTNVEVGTAGAISTPEPGAMGLLGVALLTLAGMRRRRAN